jgi:hypothetical protein
MPKNPLQDKKSIPKKRTGRDGHHLGGRIKVAPQSLAGIMKSGGWVQALREREDARRSWLEWLRAALPQDLGAAVVDAVAKGSVLTLHVASPSWAARLRFALPDLASQAQQRSPGIATLRVRVAPAGRR